ncbi:hypothetical protein BN1182_CQ_00500 [Pantoea ananatis]|nr:hypothetical protein BN1182_CQ_00500 [Pantoea ananatis]
MMFFICDLSFTMNLQFIGYLKKYKTPLVLFLFFRGLFFLRVFPSKIFHFSFIF